MRTLIIPDIHNQTQNADHWLRSQRYDRVVFLGDYFDNFGDSAGVLFGTGDVKEQVYCFGFIAKGWIIRAASSGSEGPPISF